MRDWILQASKMRTPFFGHDDNYFLGSGVAGASGNSRGVWTFAIGPDLTSPNYIQSEALVLDGIGELPFDMHRLRGCGAFFGIAMAGGVRATLTEASLMNSTKILRLLTLENETTEARTFTLEVRIAPHEAEAVACKSGIEIVKPEGAWCFGNHETRNWAERRMRIRLPGAAVEQMEDIWILKASVDLPSAAMAVFPIWHDFAYGQDYTPDAEPMAFVHAAVNQWRAWLNKGNYPGAIRDLRIRDAVESMLLCVRMQQNRDGGMIAGIRKYANSYMRDVHGGMRLLNACGHTDDVAQLLMNIHTRWEKSGFIPNWWSMGSDTFIGDSFHNNASEITAYYIFILRDYLENGGDALLAQRILPSVRWAADVQAEYLNAHDYILDFNGDETEQYCCNRDGEEYGLFGNCHACDSLEFDKSAASFASTAAAVGSLEWFGRFVGENAYLELAQKVRERIEEVFWNGEKERHGWICDANGLRDSYLTNAALLPMWLRIPLMDRHECADAMAAVAAIDGTTGYLPNCPGVMDGFCGHTLGLALYDMVALGRPEADAIAATILHSNLLGRYGTVSEFYGPGGTPNGHGCRVFEGGIVGEALVRYVQSKEEMA